MSDEGIADSPDPLVGERYRIVGLLGSGGTASVFETVDTTSGERVALKLLHPHLAEDRAFREAFVREADVLGNVRHPALCAPRGHRIEPGEPEPRAWTAWDLAPGVTLAEYVRQSGPLPPVTAVEIVVRILGGLQVLHDAGLVHRDISPSNVVVDVRNGVVRSACLVDFGLLGPAGTTTRGSDVLRSRTAVDEASGVVGNASYASPEQLRGDPVDPASDVYGVAAVLYFALVGAPPFVRSTQAETIRAHQAVVPPIASVRAPGVPSTLDRAIVRGMLKDPASRYLTAAQFGDALRPEVARVHVPPNPGETRVLTASPEGRAGLEGGHGEPVPPANAGAAPGREASPWLWVLAAGAVALAVVVAIALVPHAAPVDAHEHPIPTPVAIAPDPSPTPSSSPTRTAAPPPAIRTVPVPLVNGLPEPEARAAIEAVGLTVGGTQGTDSPAPAGVVIATAPRAGEELEPGAAVSLVVATGANLVPNVTGYSEDEAEAQLVASGFGAAVQRVASSAPPGTILETDPAALTRLSLGVRVLLIVAEPMPTHTPPATPTPAPTPGVAG